jgi:hypothetical protein
MTPFSVNGFGAWSLGEVQVLPNSSVVSTNKRSIPLIIQGAIVSARVDARKLERKLIARAGRTSDRSKDHNTIEITARYRQ